MTAINPNGNNWANSDNMGKKLLEKAGWSKGEGIGKYKQGTQVHIKVSVKNEKEGIGMKSEKRENDISLLQCFQFDNLLKSKYSKPTNNANDDQVIERGLSRSRYGRAVPKEFFKPVTTDAWNKILCKAKDNEPEVKNNEFEIVVNKQEPTNNSNLKSSYSIYEYFSMKMKNKLCDAESSDFGYDTFIVNKMETLQSYLRNKDDGNTGEKTKKKRKENDIEDTESVIKKKRKLNSSEENLKLESEKTKNDDRRAEDVEMKDQSESVSPASGKKKKSKKNKVCGESDDIKNIEMSEKSSELSTENSCIKKKKSKKNNIISESTNGIKEQVEDNSLKTSVESSCETKKKSKKNKGDCSDNSEKNKKSEFELSIPDTKTNSAELECKSPDQLERSSYKSKKSKKNKIGCEPESVPEPLKDKSVDTNNENTVSEKKSKKKRVNGKPEDIPQIEVSEQTEAQSLETSSKKMKKSKKVKINDENSQEVPSITAIVEEIEKDSKISANNNNQDHTTYPDLKQSKNTSSVTEVYEQEAFCAWDTSIVNLIQGYKY